MDAIMYSTVQYSTWIALPLVGTYVGWGRVWKPISTKDGELSDL